MDQIIAYLKQSWPQVVIAIIIALSSGGAYFYLNRQKAKDDKKEVADKELKHKKLQDNAEIRRELGMLRVLQGQINNDKKHICSAHYGIDKPLSVVDLPNYLSVKDKLDLPEIAIINDKLYGLLEEYYSEQDRYLRSLKGIYATPEEFHAMPKNILAQADKVAIYIEKLIKDREGKSKSPKL